MASPTYVHTLATLPVLGCVAKSGQIEPYHLARCSAQGAAAAARSFDSTTRAISLPISVFCFYFLGFFSWLFFCWQQLCPHKNESNFTFVFGFFLMSTKTRQILLWFAMFFVGGCLFGTEGGQGVWHSIKSQESTPPPLQQPTIRGDKIANAASIGMQQRLRGEACATIAPIGGN